jgi:hypothetical protein
VASGPWRIPLIREATIRLLRYLSPALVLLLCAGPAAAKDVCFDDGSDNIFVLEKLKKPKRAGSTFSVRGYAVLSGATFPVPIAGTGVGLGDRRVNIGITVYDASGLPIQAPWNPVKATANTEGDLGSGGWNEIPCSTVVVPEP